MINTIVKGIPSNSDEDQEFRFIVRTFYLAKEDMYVSDVIELQDEMRFPNGVVIPADSKEEKIKTGRFDTRFYHEDVCNHRPYFIRNRDKKPPFRYLVPNKMTPKRLGEVHLKVCLQIIDGKYWFGRLAVP